MKKTKQGIILDFKEDKDSISGILVAYIKEHPGKKGSKKDQQVLINDIIKLSGLDTKVWRVKEHKLTANAWGVTMKQKEFRAKSESLGETSAGFPQKEFEAKSHTWAEQAYNYQLKVEIRFERINAHVEESLKTFIKDFIPIFKYNSSIPKFDPGSGIALEVAPLDAHLGKLAWLMETGYRHYDTRIAMEDLEYAVDRQLNWAMPFKPEKIFYILGQDMYHIDNIAGKTTFGDHAMDVDGRITKIHELSYAVNLRNILKCRALAPVEIIWSPGNHDYLASHMLCFALQQYFRKDEYVTVDLGHTTRKARLWGNLLVGWTHRIVGRHNTWGNELAQAYPELWSKSIFREWHHGDQHKKQNVKLVPTFTSGGVLCRQLTALSPVDRWHFENLYTDAIPGGEAYLWSKTRGIFANFIAWTGQYDEYRNKLVKPNK